ncbi:hypothetical protein BAUCODRAFT_150362 [Baudoinia panamericana UAMH 10762]|uniref:F-box domain-containing protein n=1 Tax=Baudoinia panamericana (strain UAMH 10762) TaxID=717646 RepID=M2MCB4_BAUPA|nr:uncharacterized protein BAUCODRAFT_150362 [Baudoinia panamericana UAMH 10762]EMC94156.1 hypothetical protein BAUCODRAFT_150362 [Baudoinia panamericana UAMH 10762]
MTNQDAASRDVSEGVRGVGIQGDGAMINTAVHNARVDRRTAEEDEVNATLRRLSPTGARAVAIPHQSLPMAILPLIRGDDHIASRPRAEPIKSRPSEPDESAETLTLGNLHKRRASTSPEKFNTGRFEPLPLQLGAPPNLATERPVKRARLENKLAITYDAAGVPQVCSINPTITLPSGRKISGKGLERLRTPLTADKGPFSVVAAMVRDPDIFFRIISFLTMPSLISLYSISRIFHRAFDANYLSFILANMRQWAPNADRIYPWRFYKDLCIRNPSTLAKIAWKGKIIDCNLSNIPSIPSLRWLQMVVWRQGICQDILVSLATQGLNCVPGTFDALKRIWFIMDMPLNAYRLSLCRSEKYLSQSAIFCATAFFLKVDMAFTDPLGKVMPFNTPSTNTKRYPQEWQNCAPVGCDLRELLMAERHLTPLWRVLRGYSWDPTEPFWPMSRLDVLKLWVRQKYRLPDNVADHVKRQSIMGIPWYEVGTAGLERTTIYLHSLSASGQTAKDQALPTSMTATNTIQQPLYPHRKGLLVPVERPRERLLRPEELILREGIRRKYGLHRHWVQMMLYGFCDAQGRNLPVRSEGEVLASRL